MTNWFGLSWLCQWHNLQDKFISERKSPGLRAGMKRLWTSLPQTDQKTTLDLQKILTRLELTKHDDACMTHKLAYQPLRNVLILSFVPVNHV
jgi:hypothetical protein